MHIDQIYVGAPTYADDMSLIAFSPPDVQCMLNLVFDYIHKWRYSINSSKS